MIYSNTPSQLEQQENQAIFNPSVSFFQSKNITDPMAVYTLEQVVNGIRTNTGWQSKVEDLRKLKRNGQDDKYKEEKDKLPALTFCGIFSKRNNRSLETHSRGIMLDYDADTVTDAAGLRDRLATLPECVLAFISPSGLGIKGLFRIGTDTNAQNHHNA